MEKFKLFFNKLFVASLIIPLLMGFIGGVSAFLLMPGINRVITKYVFVPKPGDEKLAEQLQQPTKTNDERLLPNNNTYKGELNITDVVEKVSPSVVSIVVSKEVAQMQTENNLNDIFPFGLPFNIVIPEQPKTQLPKGGKQQVGGGTGFIISSDGLILTNKHVAADVDASYSVVTSSGKTYDATVIDRDPLNDLAVLKINATNLPAVKLGDSSQIKVGQTVVAIGYALGEYSNSVTKGIVSGLGRNVEAGDNSGSSEMLQDVIQTDAAINPGNSGGPLINLFGEVIGINTAVNRSGQLVGFSIPIDIAKPVISSVIKNGRIVRPYLGVRYVLLNKELAEKNKITINEGALIVSGNANEAGVLTNSPASKAGLKEGDVIMSVDGKNVSEKQPLASIIAGYQVGQSIELKVWRDGKELKIKLLLEELKTTK